MATMKRLLILKLGQTYDELAHDHGDFEDWIAAGLGPAVGEPVVIDARTEPLPGGPGAYAGIVLTGSHAMVTDREPWSVRLAGWIPRVVDAEVPLLGICYGHQIMAEALGGRVGFNPRGPEFGTVEVTFSEAATLDPLFAELPPKILAHVTHQQSVLELPPGATWLARSRLESHQAFAVGKAAWGVQFHPEFDSRVVNTYLRESRQAAAGQIVETPRSRSLLTRFAALAAGR